MGLLIKWVAVSAVFMVAAAVTPAIKVKSWGVALGAALVFGVANWGLGWLLTFVYKAITFLPAVLTFGLVWLVAPIIVNMVLLALTDRALEKDLEIKGLPALAGVATAIAIVGALL